MNLCPETDPGNPAVQCEELAGHTPLELGGRKYDHAAHSLGIAWNVEPVAPRAWNDELTEALPPYTCIVREAFRTAWAWTTRETSWSVQRHDIVIVGTWVEIEGKGVRVKLIDPSVELVINTLKLHGALDDPAITGVSWEARRWLATQFEGYVKGCAEMLAARGGATTHEEAHLNGMSAAAAWLRGELGLPVSDPTGLTVPCLGGCDSADPHNAHLAPGAAERLGGERNETVVAAELARDAWELISKAHGGQPWEARGEWRDRATEWRDRYRRENVSNGLISSAWSLLTDVEDGNWDDAPLDWQAGANDWMKRHAEWLGARS